MTGSSERLDPGRSVREEWIARAVEFVQAELDGLDEAPALGPTGEELERLLGELPRGIPDVAIPMSEALDRIARAARLGMNPATPGYLAYIPGGGLFASALAAFLSLVLNRYVGLAAASPGMVRFEKDVIALFASELGFPAGSGGILTSGGSLANLSAIVAARVASFGEEGDLRKASIYLSTEAHRSLTKAARIAGIPAHNLRSVPVDASFRMDAAELSTMLTQDTAAGYRPFLVVASAGTTNTGAIDPLGAVADCCAEHGVWFHVDGAYGAMFVLTEVGRRKLAGIERADSVTLDPHKGLFLPYGCGALVVRRQEALLAAHAESAGYLQDLVGRDGEASPAELGPELTRNDRGILVWLPLALHGLETFRQALAEKLDLARRCYEEIDRLGLEVLGEPDLSVVAFRLPRKDGEPLDGWNRRNRDWLARINDRRRIHLSSTLLPVADGEVLTLRVCILSFRTDERWTQIAIRELAETMEG